MTALDNPIDEYPHTIQMRKNKYGAWMVCGRFKSKDMALRQMGRLRTQSARDIEYRLISRKSGKGD